MPEKSDQEQELTVYDYFVDMSSGDWVRWMAPDWSYPSIGGDDSDDESNQEATSSNLRPMLRFSSLLVPTADPACTVPDRAVAEPESQMGKRPYPVMITGQSGTAKTSTALMWAQEKIDQTQTGFKFINFSSATMAYNFQMSIEESQNGAAKTSP